MKFVSRWPLILMAALAALLIISGGKEAKIAGANDASGAKRANDADTLYLPLIRQPFTGPPTIQLTKIGNAAGATDLKQAGDEALYIVEQAGRIRVYDGSQIRATPFLDITSRVDAGGEKGLLGLAFHPDYAENGYFFVNYTTSTQGSLQTRVSRFSVSAGDPLVADPNSEQVVLAFAQPQANHNGGALHFGPDGYLYVAAGDGGGSYDPGNNSQDPTSLLGTILRIDVDGISGNVPDCDQSGNSLYRIPAGNPLADGPGGDCDEIWAMGLRNPWRFSFDGQTGDLWIADVGQSAREEVDFEPAGSPGGRNYGWDCYEGNQANSTDPSPTCSGNRDDYVFPTYDYARNNGRCSVTGGYVYRGSAIPGLPGHYLFADYCSAEIWSLSSDPQNPTVTDLTPADNPLLNARTFGQDVDGELYVADGSAVYRIEVGVK